MHLTEQKIPNVLPLLPLKDVVIFPEMIITVFVSEEICLKAIDSVMATHKIIFVSAFCAEQQPNSTETPELSVSLLPPFDVYDIGTAAQVIKTRRLPDGRTKLLLQGLKRAKIVNFVEVNGYPTVGVELYQEEQLKKEKEDATKIIINQVKFGIEKLVHKGKNIPPDITMLLEEDLALGKFSDLVVSNLSIKIEEAQIILGTINPYTRLDKVRSCIDRELEYLEANKANKSPMKDERNNQRDYLIREQIKALKMEIGDNEADDELKVLKNKVINITMSKDAKEETLKQLKRLERMNPESAEASIARTYIELMIDLPWNQYNNTPINLDACKQILDEDHFGLEKIKERVVEYLAVRKLNPNVKGPILCFVGPPGVGKTSLGKSIAKALGRKFARISLGGMRDEAEIRGHRRTYVGAQPGRIIQAIKGTGSMNPVLMLDELDKLGNDYKGDPASALLEALDPEQNHEFSDHYLMVAFDLSQVIFLANANRLDTVPAALRDRLEIIDVSGYSEDEKLQIAKNYIIPKVFEQHGLKKAQVNFQDNALSTIISGYTRESGLRSLEKNVAAVARKLARTYAEKSESEFLEHKIKITPKLVKEYLGEEFFMPSRLDITKPRVGVALGLAYTSGGGDILELEVNLLPGKGNFILTGQLGEVMRESAQTALSYVKSKAQLYSIDEKLFSENDIHVHAPAGAIPKDGPSAGVTIMLAMLSVYTNRSIKQNIAMTGEISLHGKVLPVGGLREKILAATRYGLSAVCVPELNKGSIQEIPESIRNGIKIHFIKSVDELIAICLNEIANKKGGTVANPSPKSRMWPKDSVAASGL